MQYSLSDGRGKLNWLFELITNINLVSRDNFMSPCLSISLSNVVILGKHLFPKCLSYQFIFFETSHPFPYWRNTLSLPFVLCHHWLHPLMPHSGESSVPFMPLSFTHESLSNTGNVLDRLSRSWTGPGQFNAQELSKLIHLFYPLALNLWVYIFSQCCFRNINI